MALTAFMLPLLATGMAFAQTGLEVGIQDDFVFVGHSYNPDRLLNQARQLKTSYVRVFLTWADVREIGGNPKSRRVPRHRRYDFRIWDGLWVRATYRRHIQLQFLLTGPIPAWAAGNHRKGVFPGRQTARYFKEFAAQAAAHFRGRVERYSIWNEPNFKGWLQPMNRAPSEYRSLYGAAYNGIKGADPNAQVLIGETSPYAERGRAWAPLSFLRAVLCNGRCHLKTDGYAHHPYDFYHSPSYHYPGSNNVTISTLSRLRNALDHWASVGALTTPSGGVPEEYLTEFGYLSSGHARIPDKRHARYLVKAFQIALAEPHVRELLQYTMVPPRGRYKFFDMSILTSRGKPRAAFKALERWAQTEANRHLIEVLY